MLNMLQPANMEKSAAMMKAYLEHIARNSRALGINDRELGLLKNRLFSVAAGCFPGEETPSTFISFNMSENDTRRFIHRPGECTLTPVSYQQAVMLDTTFVILASTDKKHIRGASDLYAGAIRNYYGFTPACKPGENIIIEDGFANKKGEKSSSSVLLFTEIVVLRD